MFVLGVEGSEKKMSPPDNFWNSPKQSVESVRACRPVEITEQDISLKIRSVDFSISHRSWTSIRSRTGLRSIWKSTHPCIHWYR